MSNEPMSRSLPNRNWAATGRRPAAGGGVVSVAIASAGGGEGTSRIALVHCGPPWQLAQPADRNSRRPTAITPVVSPGREPRRASGPLGVRIARRTHSRRAVMAGTATLEPGSVTVTCRRSTLDFTNPLVVHGGVLMSPLSPMIRPWLGSSVLVAGGGSEQMTATA